MIDKIEIKMKEDSSKILSKIEKLMRLSKSANQNEASLALKKALKLMETYNINHADLFKAQIQEAYGARCSSQKPPMYVAHLATLVSTLFSCKFYWSTSLDKKLNYNTRPVFVGFSPHQEIAVFTYDNLLRKITKSRRKYYSSYRKKSNITADKDSYALGWIEGVRRNLEHLIPSEHFVEVSGESGLIRVNPIVAHIEEKTEGDMECKQRPTSTLSMKKGFIDGSLTKINKGVDFNNSKQSYLE